MNLMKLSLGLLLALCGLAPAAAQGEPGRARLFLDKDGYVEVKSLTADWSALHYDLNLTKKETLELKSPDLTVKAVVALSPKITGNWEVGWILILRDTYQSTRWQELRTDVRASQLPVNLGPQGQPWYLPAGKPVKLSTVPVTLSFNFGLKESLPWLKWPQQGPTRPLTSSLFEKNWELYLAVRNTEQNIFALIRQVAFTAGWELAVDPAQLREKGVKLVQDILPKPAVKTPAEFKLFPADLLAAPDPATVLQTWNDVISQN